MMQERIDFITRNWGVLTCYEIAKHLEMSEDEVRKVVRQLRRKGMKLPREKREDDVVRAVIQFIEQMKNQNSV